MFTTHTVACCSQASGRSVSVRASNREALTDGGNDFPSQKIRWRSGVMGQGGGLSMPIIHSTLLPICKKVRLTTSSWYDAAHPSCDSPKTSRRLALGASNACLVGENPTSSVPGIVEGLYMA